MIKKIFFGFINLSILIYFYISKNYNLNLDMMKAIIITLYYVYWLSYDNTDKKQVEENLKKGCLTVFDICKLKINTYGFKITDVPIIYISNHSSYLDSVILKYYLPHIHTIAKSDANKEFFLSNILNEVFKTWGVISYKRGNKKSGKKVRKIMKDHIGKGGSILVYPEGTAYAIGGPNNFYPGSFEVSFDNNILIQPITIKYGTDITWGVKTKYTKEYHIDTLKNAYKCQKQLNDVHVTFHPIIKPSNFKDARHMKQYCEIIIRDEWINQHHYTESSI